MQRTNQKLFDEKPNDIIFILRKGHESYKYEKPRKNSFSKWIIDQHLIL